MVFAGTTAVDGVVVDVVRQQRVDLGAVDEGGGVGITVGVDVGDDVDPRAPQLRFRLCSG
ncbi:hypothetical protein [Streptomyces sp. NPDC096311]|uniref:hypothetical protein n=1 Tax=Streptomyces sp. NPDC096311 TaxID=3366083 RepID=UPI00381A62EE